MIFYMYQKHHWGEGKAVIGLRLNRIRTLVSVTTDSFHRVIMGKTVLPLFLGYFSSDFFILASSEDIHESSEELEVWPDPTTHCGVSCAGASGKNH